MADINVNVNKTNDPSYLNSSQGTDRASLQPLAGVPDLSTKYVQPDWATDKSAAIGIKGVGDLAENALKLTDAVIQKKADDILTTGINSIRDEFGVAAAVDKDNSLAQDAGKAGQDGTSLLGKDQPQLPVALTRFGSRVDGLMEQYNQGELSNSRYYAKLEAFTREVKAQFPGYEKEIDNMASQKTGVISANALRSSLLQDAQAIASKVQGLNDKWTTYEHSNAGAIYNIWPNYDQLKANGQITRAQVEAGVGRWEARKAAIDAEKADLALTDARSQAGADRANDFAIRIGSDISRNVVVGFSNSMGINDVGDFKQYIIDVAAGKRKPPTPDEQAQLIGIFNTLEQKATASFNAAVNQPLNQNTTETLASRLRSPQKLDEARNVALSDIRTIKDGLLNEQHGLVASTAMWNKANDSLADKNLATNMPNAVIAGAIRRKLGDQTLSNLIIDTKTGVGADLMVGLQQTGWVSIDKGESAHSVIEKFSQDDPSGAASKQFIRDGKNMIINSDKLADKSVADGAIKSFYGQGNRLLIDAFNKQPGAQVQVFNDLTDPKITAAIAKRSKSDQQMYTQWAEDGFTSVYQTQANQVNQTTQAYAANGNIKLVFNPKSENFEYQAGAAFPKGYLGAATQSLAPLNSAINGMKDVLKLEGRSATEFLAYKLPVLGIEPDSPLYKAIISAQADKVEGK